MYTIFAILIIISSVLLVLVVLVQNPKGGGLSSSFGGGGNQIMGAKKTTDFLEKATWTLAIALISLSLLSNFAIERKSSEDNLNIKGQEQIDETSAPSLPSIPFKE
jgi:preprotein translocase subunit SecG|tara:strand:- start:5173 stop:5490 length:318 start_codon:yes stop_codon:yes gene_type:complete